MTTAEAKDCYLNIIEQINLYISCLKVMAWIIIKCLQNESLTL